MADPPRIAILGAGSVGSFIGGAWQAAGLAVTFIGRQSFARDIGRHGLSLSDFAGWHAHLDPREVDYRCTPDALAEADLIALCVKSSATEEAARQIADHGRDNATVISFQNGIGNADLLERALASRFAIVRGMVPFNVAYLGEGRFHKGVAGSLFADDRPETRQLSECIGSGPAAVRLSSDMAGLAWGKLLINLNNAVNALSGVTLIEQLRQRDYRRVVAAAQREALAILARAGIAPAKVGPVSPHLLPTVIGSPDWLFNSLFLKGWKIDSKARSSMADDLAHGRKTEIDVLNGEVVRLARSLDMDAPINRAIAALVIRAESGAPPIAPAELRRAVLGR